MSEETFELDRNAAGPMAELIEHLLVTLELLSRTGGHTAVLARKAIEPERLKALVEQGAERCQPIPPNLFGPM